MDDQLKVALVTGASRGIGRAIAEALAGAGFAVIGTATSSAGAEQITARFVEKNFVGQGMVLNVNDTASISLLLKEVDENFGAPTVLVNNAGITKDNILLRMKEDEWSDVVNTNLNAVFRLSKACVRAMTKAKWGRIVNISSVVGSMGNSGQSNYSATKAGVEGFSRALAKELGSRNITVNTVAPGFIDTDMTKNLPVASKDAMLSQIPLARLGEPSEIADVVSFLVSDSAGYITGETIHVNGGMYMA
jgi:3-oxoacyl-[acyl-carrier protein] reductase